MNTLWATLQAVWVFVLLAGAGFLIQGQLTSHLSIFGARPDLILAALVLLSRSTGPGVGALSGFALGLMEDGLMPERLGLNAAIQCTVGFVCGHLKEGIFWDSPITSGLIIFLAALFHDLMVLLATSWGHWAAAGMYFLAVSLPSALYTAVLIPLLAYAVPRMIRGRE